LKEVGKMGALEMLSLSQDAKVTDAGLKELHGLAKLRGLDVSGTKVTAAGLAEFRKAVPGCAVRFNDNAKLPFDPSAADASERRAPGATSRPPMAVLAAVAGSTAQAPAVPTGSGGRARVPPVTTRMGRKRSPTQSNHRAEPTGSRHQKHHG